MKRTIQVVFSDEAKASNRSSSSILTRTNQEWLMDGHFGAPGSQLCARRKEGLRAAEKPLESRERSGLESEARSRADDE